MFQPLLKTLGDSYDILRHRQLLEDIWRQEVWFDSPHQEKAAEVAIEAMRSARMSAELIAYPADGRTRYQDWIAPFAWECKSARLAFADGDRALLADRQECPLAVVIFAGPLPQTTAEVVDGDALAEITPAAVRGKFVLTAGKPLPMKHRLLGMGALAVVSDFLGEGPGYLPDVTKWCNTWSDSGPDGWYCHEGDTQLAGFNITPRRGQLLRERLKANPHLKLTGHCDGRWYVGHGNAFTGLLAGTDPSQEIMMLGHSAEEGADDNCSGVSTMIEALRLLSDLIDTGKLPRPRRSIRMMAAEECMGTVAFGTLRPEILRRTLGSIMLDSVAHRADPEKPFLLQLGPASNPGFGWAMAGLLCRRLAQAEPDKYPFRLARRVATADDMIADPACGVPSMWAGHGGLPYGYHASSDTPSAISDDSLRIHTLMLAAWAYTMADMDESSATEMLPAVGQWIDDEFLRRGGDQEALDRYQAACLLRDLRKWGISESVYESLAGRYSPAGEPPLAGLPADGPVYARKVWGVPRMEYLPYKRREGLSSWNDPQMAAWFWADGKRSLAAIRRLALAETGTDLGDTAERLFETGVEASIVERVR